MTNVAATIAVITPQNARVRDVLLPIPSIASPTINPPTSPPMCPARLIPGIVNVKTRFNTIR